MVTFGTRLALVAIALSLIIPSAGTASASDLVADEHTLATPDLAPGQLEVLTTSTFPDAVTGGGVLARVRGAAPDDTLVVSVDGEPVPNTWETPDGTDVLVTGLTPGDHDLSARAEGATYGTRTATLTIRNHPISGPVISGPHQTPFRCRTIDAGLGAAVDEATCWAPTSYRWFAYTTNDYAWHELADPKVYPSNTATTVLRSANPGQSGKVVPFVARVETSVINRGIARIAVLDDPASRADAFAFAPHWNGRVYHAFGQSCGVGYDQGRNSIGAVLGSPTSGSIDTDNALGLITRLGEGDAVVHSTLTSYGNHCNPFVSAETSLMLKEHIAETYPRHDGTRAPVTTYIGAGNSGGALQQYNLANNAPGVLDAAMASTSFADTTTLAMTTSDCVLFVDYFGSTDLDWNEAQRAAVTGLNPQSGSSVNSICQSWAPGTRSGLDATQSCGGLAPEQRYHPTNNRTGARCTVADANVNWLGRDANGAAFRPLDNVGVQYGLVAFRQGLISFEQFVDLNRRIGGFDNDGKRQPGRHAMRPETAEIVYRVGQVIGRGALAETPIIDFAPYLDPVFASQLNIHDSSRPLINRHRVRQAGGSERTMAIWRGVVVPADGFNEIDQWVDGLHARPAGGDRIADVEATKPLTSMDQCALGTFGGSIEAPSTLRGPLALPVRVAPGTPVPDVRVPMRVFVPEDHERGIGPCSQGLPPVRTTRQAAGGPDADDVIKCQRKPITRDDYGPGITDEQLAELSAIFPDGVCDWSKPSVGDGGPSLRWPSLGGQDAPVDHEGKIAPVELRWRVARSS